MDISPKDSIPLYCLQNYKFLPLIQSLTFRGLISILIFEILSKSQKIGGATSPLVPLLTRPLLFIHFSFSFSLTLIFAKVLLLVHVNLKIKQYEWIIGSSLFRVILQHKKIIEQSLLLYLYAANGINFIAQKFYSASGDWSYFWYFLHPDVPKYPNQY